MVMSPRRLSDDIVSPKAVNGDTVCPKASTAQTVSHSSIAAAGSNCILTVELWIITGSCCALMLLSG